MFWGQHPRRHRLGVRRKHVDLLTCWRQEAPDAGVGKAILSLACGHHLPRVAMWLPCASVFMFSWEGTGHLGLGPPCRAGSPVKLTSANTVKSPEELGPGFHWAVLGRMRPLRLFIAWGGDWPSLLQSTVLTFTPWKVPADFRALLAQRRHGHAPAAPRPSWIGRCCQEGRWRLCPWCPSLSLSGVIVCLCSLRCMSLPRAPGQQGLC